MTVAKGKDSALTNFFRRKVDKISEDFFSRTITDPFDQAFLQTIRDRISALPQDIRPIQLDNIQDFMTPTDKVGTIVLSASLRPEALYPQTAAASTLERAVDESLFQIFGERLELPGSSTIFLQMAAHQYEETRNPLWPWMVFGIYSLAGSLPPSWVCDYFFRITMCVCKGAAELRPNGTSVDNAKSERTLTEVLGLTKDAGTRDRFSDFRQVITDFRLALRVRALAFPASGEGVRMMQACRSVAVTSRTDKKRLTEREVKNVYRAYRRWFTEGGIFHLTPLPRHTI